MRANLWRDLDNDAKEASISIGRGERTARRPYIAMCVRLSPLREREREREREKEGEEREERGPESGGGRSVRIDSPCTRYT